MYVESTLNIETVGLNESTEKGKNSYAVGTLYLYLPILAMYRQEIPIAVILDRTRKLRRAAYFVLRELG